MTLTLVDAPSGFETEPGFNPQWWRPRISQTDSTLLSVLDQNSSEVARVEMIDRTNPIEYVGLNERRRFIKIQFIEVRTDLQCRGVGLMVLGLLADRYAERQLVAFSEADAFWEKTGWSRHTHREDDPARPRHQPLYVQPG